LKLFPERMRYRWARTRLSKVARAIKDEHLTYLSLERLRNIENSLRTVERTKTPGDFIEFGVALGGSAIMICSHLSLSRTFHGFDVFGMIPPPSEGDDAKSKARYEVIISGKSAGIGGEQYYGYRENLYDQVVESFARFGRPVDHETIYLHKGLFQDTWNEYGGASIAFVHIDCDWYEPVKFCLNSIYPHLSIGAHIVIDDYNDYGGCRQATNEFLGIRHDTHIIKSDSNVVLVREQQTL
jgi:O-methyltransferase